LGDSTCLNNAACWRSVATRADASRARSLNAVSSVTFSNAATRTSVGSTPRRRVAATAPIIKTAANPGINARFGERRRGRRSVRVSSVRSATASGGVTLSASIGGCSLNGDGASRACSRDRIFSNSAWVSGDGASSSSAAMPSAKCLYACAAPARSPARSSSVNRRRTPTSSNGESSTLRRAHNAADEKSSLRACWSANTRAACEAR